MNLSSKLNAVKTAVTSSAGRQILLGKKHSPVILFGVGTVGVVASTVLACKATLSLHDVLDEFSENRAKADEAREVAPERYTEQVFNRDVAILHAQRAAKIVKLYGPALAVGALSVCALGGSHLILSKRNAGLMAAYAALDKGFKEYRDRVVSEVGVDREKEIRYGYEEREIVDDEGREVSTIRTVDAEAVKKNGTSIYARIFDQGNINYQVTPELNLYFLRCQQNWANDKLRARGHLFLNDVYDLLSLPHTKEGQVVGWVKGNGDNYVDFGLFDGDNPFFIDFVNGREGAILLDFNVDGVVWDLI